MTITSDTRLQLLGVDDSNVLSDSYVALMLSDAKEDTSITDETNKSLRYYVCYLIALNWESIGAIRSREGVQYVPPDPDKYLNLYNKSIAKTLDDSSGIIAVKESTTAGNIIQDNGVMIKGDYPDSSN